jgi:hypothetical protein
MIKSKKEETDGTCSVGVGKSCVKIYLELLQGRDYSEDLVVDGTIMLK